MFLKGLDRDIAMEAVVNLRKQREVITGGSADKDEIERFREFEARQSLLIKNKIASIFDEAKKDLPENVRNSVDLVLMGSAGRGEMVPYSDLDMVFLVRDKNLLDGHSAAIAQCIKATRRSLEIKFNNLLHVDTYAVFDTDVMTPELLLGRHKNKVRSTGVNSFMPIVDVEFVSDSRHVKKGKWAHLLFKSVQDSPTYFLQEWQRKIADESDNLKSTIGVSRSIDIKQCFYRMIYLFVGYQLFQLGLQSEEKLFTDGVCKHGFQEKINFLTKNNLISEGLAVRISEVHSLIVYGRHFIGIQGRNVFDSNEISEPLQSQMLDAQNFLLELAKMFRGEVDATLAKYQSEDRSS